MPTWCSQQLCKHRVSVVNDYLNTCHMGPGGFFYLLVASLLLYLLPVFYYNPTALPSAVSLPFLSYLSAICNQSSSLLQPLCHLLPAFLSSQNSLPPAATASLPLFTKLSATYSQSSSLLQPLYHLLLVFLSFPTFLPPADSFSLL